MNFLFKVLIFELAVTSTKIEIWIFQLTIEIKKKVFSFLKVKDDAIKRK